MKRPDGPTLRNVAIIIVAAVAVRLVMLALFDPAAGATLGDSAYFLSADLSSRLHPPGYVAVLNLVGVKGIFLFQTAVTIAVSILAERKIGLLAGLLVASSPFLAIYEMKILADIIACQLTFAAFLLLDLPLVAGLLLGLAILTRDTVQLLPLFLIPFAVWYGKGRQAVVVALMAYAVVAPVAVTRGGLSEGRLGFNLWIGTWERNGDWYLTGLNNPKYPANAFRNDADRRRLGGPWDVRNEPAYREAALDRIKDDPFGTARTWAIRYPRQWLGTRTDQMQSRLDRGSMPWTVMKAGFWVLNLLVLVLGFVGMVKHRGLLAVPVLYFAAVLIPFHNTEPRYTLGALPFLYVFAAKIASDLSTLRLSRKLRLSPRSLTPPPA